MMLPPLMIFCKFAALDVDVRQPSLFRSIDLGAFYSALELPEH